jgi:type III secretion protein J
MRMARLGAAGLCALALAGCKVDLYANLDQRSANDIVATLLRHGIPAERSIAKGGHLTVSIDEDRFADAVRILNDDGLPKQDFANIGEVFKKDGLVSSPVQERAQMIFALSQELSRTVSDIDGVLSARVHLVLPENDPLRQQLIPSSASVFIRHHASVPIGELVPQVKMLVANGVSGLSYDKVSVVLIPVETHQQLETGDQGLVFFRGLWLHRDSVTRAAYLFYGLIGIAVALAAALGFVLWRQRQQIYVLPTTAAAKPS